MHLTNNFGLSPQTITDIYKERWQIEIFSRWIKQNLKIKAFIGNSANASMAQICVALIAYLLLCYFKFLSGVNIGLQELLRLLHNYFSLTFSENSRYRKSFPQMINMPI